MADTPAHGPDRSTPSDQTPKGAGSDAKRGRKRPKRRRKPARQHNDPAGDTKATPPAAGKPLKSGRKRGNRRKTPRGTAADVEALTSLILERLLLGERRRDILRFLAKALKAKELRWPSKEGPSPRTVDDYIARATTEIRTLSTAERDEARAAARGRFLLVIRKAHDANDFGTVRLATRDLARIDGLEPVRVQHSGSVLTEHTGTVTHEVATKPASLEETAAAVTDLLTRARSRMIAANPATITPPSSN